jgi:hypothetical protein
MHAFILKKLFMLRNDYMTALLLIKTIIIIIIIIITTRLG